MELDAATAHCFSGTLEVMCAGDVPLGNLLYCPPELLLSAEKNRFRTKSGDLWMFACCLHHLYADLFMFPINETQSDYAQLMEIFKVLGTPNEVSWPGVSLFANYMPNFPVWNKSIESTLALEPDVSDLLKNLFTFPLERMNAKDALNHVYFDELKKLVGEKLMDFDPNPTVLYNLKHSNIPADFPCNDLLSPVSKIHSPSVSLHDRCRIDSSLSQMIAGGLVSRSMLIAFVSFRCSWKCHLHWPCYYGGIYSRSY